jgi:hypothetical protein
MTIENADLERILNRVHEWTRSADHKIDVLIAIEAVVIGVLADNLLWWLTIAEVGTLARFCFGLAGAGLSVGIGLGVLALFPITRNPTRYKSVTFFGDVAGTTLDEYRKRLGSISDEELREDFVSQIHACSKIAADKHWWIKASVGMHVGSLAWLAIVRYGVSRWG